MTKVLAIIQARTGSSRLPNKMIMKINNKSAVGYVIDAVKNCRLVDEVVLATTIKPEDQVLLKEAELHGVKGFAGSENDVLDRFYQAAKNFGGDVIVRINGDCTLHDSELIEKIIRTYIESDSDYVSDTFPATYPDGLDAEAFSFKALEKAWNEAKLQSEREHVTPYIWKNPGIFKIINVKNNEDLSYMRWTLDEEKDFRFIKGVIEELNGRKITLKNVLDVLNENPEILKINQELERNEGYFKTVMGDMKKKYKKNLELLEQSKKIIPTAAQTYSKSYNYFCEGAGPVFLLRGKGSHVWDVDGNEFIDFVLGLGAITIGYNDEKVNNSITEQLKNGISFSLSTELEIKLAEKIIEIIPCAEMVKFVKNGSDATTACIRLARAYTGKEIVAACGYHGYHDWNVGTTDNNKGVPNMVKELTKRFEYNNIESLRKIFDENKNNVAAVILEPCQGNGPENNFLEKVKELAHENDSVLVFDEVVSGFRIGLGGAQEFYKINPDLSSLGKGIGNGMPISIFCGKKEIMELIDKGAFISTTFGGESLSLAAALKTIEILEKPESFMHIWNIGEMLKKGLQKIINEKGLQNIAEIIGLPVHCGPVFKNTGKLDSKDLFSIYQENMINNGILTLGINNLCVSHSKEDIEKFLKAAEIALEKVKECVELDSIEGRLYGKKFRPIFKR